MMRNWSGQDLSAGRWGFYDPSLGPHQKQLIKLQDFLGCMHSRYSADV